MDEDFAISTPASSKLKLKFTPNCCSTPVCVSSGSNSFANEIDKSDLLAPDSGDMFDDRLVDDNDSKNVVDSSGSVVNMSVGHQFNPVTENVAGKINADSDCPIAVMDEINDSMSAMSIIEASQTKRTPLRPFNRLVDRSRSVLESPAILKLTSVSVGEMPSNQKPLVTGGAPVVLDDSLFDAEYEDSAIEDPSNYSPARGSKLKEADPLFFNDEALIDEVSESNDESSNDDEEEDDEEDVEDDGDDDDVGSFYSVPSESSSIVTEKNERGKDIPDFCDQSTLPVGDTNNLTTEVDAKPDLTAANELLEQKRLKKIELVDKLNRQEKMVKTLNLDKLPDKGESLHRKIEKLNKSLAKLKSIDVAASYVVVHDHKDTQSTSVAVVKSPVDELFKLGSSKNIEVIPGNIIEEGIATGSKSEQSLERVQSHHNASLPIYSCDVLEDLLEVFPHSKKMLNPRTNDMVFREVRAMTMDAIGKIHGAITHCPVDKEEVSDPHGLRHELMPHQRQALKWLQWRESEMPPGGILADDMGLGKTLTMIAFVLMKKLRRLKASEESDPKYRQFERTLRQVSERQGVIKSHATLVICPTSLMSQWEAEVKKHVRSGKLDVCTYHGPKREKNPRQLSKYDIVLTTYGTVRAEVDPKNTRENKSDDDDEEYDVAKDRSCVLMRIGWRCIILDEAHEIKNQATSQSKACCMLPAISRWSVTGTPVHNKLEEFYSQLKFLRCNPFDDFSVFKEYILPAQKKSERANQRLQTLVKALILRRTKAQKDELTGESLLSLPSRSHNVISLTFGATEQKVYDKLFESSKKYVAEFIKSQEQRDYELDSISTGRKTQQDFGYRNPFAPKATRNPVKSQKASGIGVLTVLLRLRQACAHLALMREAIDVEALKDTSQLEGNNEGDGIEEKMEELSMLEDEDVVKEHEVEELFETTHLNTKISELIKVLYEIMKDDSNGVPNRCVIVSEWTSYLSIIERHLKNNKIRCTSITGAVSLDDRADRLKQFNRLPKQGAHDYGPDVMLLSLRAGGVGLNLVGANHLFFMDLHWNPQLENQAADRIYRVGQTRPVFIHKYVCTNTIEERILALQDDKLKLASNLTSVKNMNKLSLNDLKKLFELEEKKPRIRRNNDDQPQQPQPDD